MLLYRFYQKLRVIKRFNQILLIFFKAGFSVFLAQEGLKKHVPISHQLDTKLVQIQEEILAIKFRETLERLGPIFVKFGQVLSTSISFF